MAQQANKIVDLFNQTTAKLVRKKTPLENLIDTYSSIELKKALGPQEGTQKLQEIYGRASLLLHLKKSNKITTWDEQELEHLLDWLKNNAVVTNEKEAQEELSKEISKLWDTSKDNLQVLDQPTAPKPSSTSKAGELVQKQLSLRNQMLMLNRALAKEFSQVVDNPATYAQIEQEFNDAYLKNESQAANTLKQAKEQPIEAYARHVVTNSPTLKKHLQEKSQGNQETYQSFVRNVSQSVATQPSDQVLNLTTTTAKQNQSVAAFVSARDNITVEDARQKTGTVTPQERAKNAQNTLLRNISGSENVAEVIQEINQSVQAKTQPQDSTTPSSPKIIRPDFGRESTPEKTIETSLGKLGLDQTQIEKTIPIITGLAEVASNPEISEVEAEEKISVTKEELTNALVGKDKAKDVASQDKNARSQSYQQANADKGAVSTVEAVFSELDTNVDTSPVAEPTIAIAKQATTIVQQNVDNPQAAVTQLKELFESENVTDPQQTAERFLFNAQTIKPGSTVTEDITSAANTLVDSQVAAVTNPSRQLTTQISQAIESSPVVDVTASAGLVTIAKNSNVFKSDLDTSQKQQLYKTLKTLDINNLDSATLSPYLSKPLDLQNQEDTELLNKISFDFNQAEDLFNQNPHFQPNQAREIAEYLVNIEQPTGTNLIGTTNALTLTNQGEKVPDYVFAILQDNIPGFNPSEADTAQLIGVLNAQKNSLILFVNNKTGHNLGTHDLSDGETNWLPTLELIRLSKETGLSDETAVIGAYTELTKQGNGLVLGGDFDFSGEYDGFKFLKPAQMESLRNRGGLKPYVFTRADLENFHASQAQLFFAPPRQGFIQRRLFRRLRLGGGSSDGGGGFRSWLSGSTLNFAQPRASFLGRMRTGLGKLFGGRLAPPGGGGGNWSGFGPQASTTTEGGLAGGIGTAAKVLAKQLPDAFKDLGSLVKGLASLISGPIMSAIISAIMGFLGMIAGVVAATVAAIVSSIGVIFGIGVATIFVVVGVSTFAFIISLMPHAESLQTGDDFFWISKTVVHSPDGCPVEVEGGIQVWRPRRVDPVADAENRYAMENEEFNADENKCFHYTVEIEKKPETPSIRIRQVMDSFNLVGRDGTNLDIFLDSNLVGYNEDNQIPGKPRPDDEADLILDEEGEIIQFSYEIPFYFIEDFPEEEIIDSYIKNNFLITFDFTDEEGLEHTGVQQDASAYILIGDAPEIIESFGGEAPGKIDAYGSCPILDPKITLGSYRANNPSVREDDSGHGGANYSHTFSIPVNAMYEPACKPSSTNPRNSSCVYYGSAIDLYSGSGDSGVRAPNICPSSCDSCTDLVWTVDNEWQNCGGVSVDLGEPCSPNWGYGVILQAEGNCGHVYRLYLNHLKSYSNKSSYEPGEGVGYYCDNTNTSCTAGHLHIELTIDGVPQRPEDIMCTGG